jgi:hypothetical protein
LFCCLFICNIGPSCTGCIKIFYFLPPKLRKDVAYVQLCF